MAGLGQRLLAGDVLHLPCNVSHARRGEIPHAFRYGVDYVLLAPGHARPMALFSLDRFNLFSFWRRDHGGARGAGQGANWAWAVLEGAGLTRQDGLVLGLLTQPRFAGFWFNPVSFWLALRDDTLVAVIAEVNNTFGQRHSYLCHLPDFAPITASTAITAAKVFHVSPFQDVAGQYRFRFQIGPDRVAIQIDQTHADQGMAAAMSGPLQPLTNRRILGAALRRPGGALRVVALIFWNALRLKVKGAAYRPVPPPPDNEVSR